MDIVIGLIGAKGAGKSTAYSAAAEFSQNVQEITLANKLKEVCSSVFGIPRAHFDSHAFKEKEMENYVFLTSENLRSIFAAYDANPDFDKYIRPHIGKVLETPRKIAQYVGSEVLRSYQDSIHCTEAVKNISKKVGIVTDIRFPNELEFFSSNFKNFHLLYIQNTGAETNAGKDVHVSEAYLKDLAKKATKVIDNNTDIKSFKDRVKEYLSEVLKNA